MLIPIIYVLLLGRQPSIESLILSLMVGVLILILVWPSHEIRACISFEISHIRDSSVGHTVGSLVEVRTCIKLIVLGVASCGGYLTR